MYLCKPLPARCACREHACRGDGLLLRAEFALQLAQIRRLVLRPDPPIPPILDEHPGVRREHGIACPRPPNKLGVHDGGPRAQCLDVYVVPFELSRRLPIGPIDLSRQRIEGDELGPPVAQEETYHACYNAPPAPRDCWRSDRARWSRGRPAPGR